MHALIITALLGKAPVLVFNPEDAKAPARVITDTKAPDEVSTAPILPTKIERLESFGDEADGGGGGHEKATVTEKQMILDNAKPGDGKGKKKQKKKSKGTP